MAMKRDDGRGADELRPIAMTPDYILHPEGSVLVTFGDTKVLCNATLEKKVPRWMEQQDVRGGWVTAEYALLPRSTRTRTARETNGLRGRTQEIRRLIGRSLRAAIRLDLLDGYTCTLDCDVLQADGGTRTASVSGGYVALVKALQPLIQAGELPAAVLETQVAAISVGMMDGEPLLDLNYGEDSSADVDFNVVMNDRLELIEMQGMAEGRTFSRADLERMLDLAEKGMQEIFRLQRQTLGVEELS